MKPKTSTSSARVPAHLQAALHTGLRAGRKTAAGNLLSKLQKARLSQEAAAAFAHQEKVGLVEVPFGTSRSAAIAEWRRKQLAEAGFPASLTACTNHQFRGIRAHFEVLAGKDVQAFRNYMRTGRVKDHGAEEDTHERREELRALILRAVLEHAARITPGNAEYSPMIAHRVAEAGGMLTAAYVVAIAKQKCRGRDLASLTAGELAQILYTIRNRISAREGRGSKRGRNKSQRKS